MRLPLLLLAVPLLAGASPCPGQTTLWIETEQFADLGGWVRDAQFVDQMGSPYLLAIGLHQPVDDAVTRVEVPRAGAYRLWVRCRDWVPEYSPGRFQVILGGKPFDHVFGAGKKDGWVWEDGGTRQIEPGRLEIRLHDLTGHYGRCDALVLSSDPSFRPAQNRQALAAVRERLGGVSRQVKAMPRYDTLVVGGGLAGTFAAVASARRGCKTALLQDRPVLGGNASTEVLVLPQGDNTREPLDPGEGGIVEEVRGDSQGYSARMLALAKAEENLDLFLNTHATGVKMKDAKRIEAVTALDVVTGRRMLFPATIVIDCTGDGSIGVWAGAEYRHGREPRSMYGESRAPEKGDTHTMGGTLRYASELRGGPVPFVAPDWARKFPHCSDIRNGRHPQLRFGGWQWVIEYGGMFDTYADAEPIRDELLRIIWGLWDHVKNHCPKLSSRAADYELTWVSYVAGKRESRRLIGDYVMTEHDIAEMTRFPDRVAYGGWGIDLHPPGGFYDQRPPAEFSVRRKFSIPFRSLYSKDIDNLMMAGRCISVSHAALGATRVMITCGVQGQAVGTAAGFCKRHQTTPRGVYESYVPQLQQQLLKDGCYLVDLPDQDPADLALAATATASSVAPPESYRLGEGADVHELTCDRAVMFRVKQDHVDKIALYLHSDRHQPTPITATLRPAAQLGDFASQEDLAKATATVPPESKGWVEFPLSASVAPGGYYYVWLPKTSGIRWSLFLGRPPHTRRAYRSGAKWNVMDACYMFQLTPPGDTGAQPPGPSRPEKIFAATNVVNGLARAVRGWPNSWRPNPKLPLPQWVELHFSRPVALDTVHVSFQSKAMRAEAFRIEVADGDAWRTVAEVTGNPDRRRVLRFDRVTAAKLRLVITEAREGMGVCEIRAYDEP